MSRRILDPAHIHPAITAKVADYHKDVVDEVQAAIAANAVVVIGMRSNPFPRRARKALDAAGVAHKYLEYGSYFSAWHPRLALKMWCGWPTLPMIFVKGTLVGGASDLQRLIENGELKKMLAG